MSGPIKPSEVTKLKVKKIIPEVVFETFNETIAKHLDVEDAYRAAGWSVEYDRPGYCETYEATFEFSRRTRG